MIRLSEEALEFQRTYDWCQHNIRVSDEIAGMLNFCFEKGIPLGCITNGTSQHQRMKFKALGLDKWITDDRLLVTGDIGINKPDSRVFQEAARRMKFDPKEAWYIGDSYKNDVAGAKSAGMKAIWLDRKKESEKMEKCAADKVVHSEKELNRCIREIAQVAPVQVSCPARVPLSIYLRQQKAAPPTPCGGRGNCGKCKVRVIKGELKASVMFK